jgi:hypothetical protein
MQIVLRRWHSVMLNYLAATKEYLVQDPDGYLLRFVEILGSRPLTEREA